MEIWRKIEGFEGYEVSNLGRVKSLKFGKERILKSGKDSGGYLIVVLSKDKIPKCKTIHKLVAMAFLDHIPDGTHKLVVNHIDFNRLNNNINNMEIISQRENTNRKHLKSTSKYTGVSWNKASKKWMSMIRINGKLKYLGYFNTELEAHKIYQNKLAEISII